jgi:aldehyde:ferredoxin oxidoreductase
MALADSVTFCKFDTLDKEGLFENELTHLFNVAF